MTDRHSPPLDGWQTVGRVADPVFTCEITHVGGQHLHSVALVARNERQAQVFALDHYRAKQQSKGGGWAVDIDEKIASSKVVARQWNDKAVDDYNRSSTKSNLKWVHKRIKDRQMKLQQIDTITKKAYTAEIKKKGQSVGVVYVQAKGRAGAALVAADCLKQNLIQDRVFSPQDADRFLANVSTALYKWTEKQIEQYNQGYNADARRVFGWVTQPTKNGGSRVDRAIRYLEGSDLGKGLLAVMRVKFGAVNPDDKSRDRALSLLTANDLIDLYLMGRDKSPDAGVMRQLFALVDKFKELLDPSMSKPNNTIPVLPDPVAAVGFVDVVTLGTPRHDSPPRVTLDILLESDITGDILKLGGEMIEIVIDDQKVQIRPQRTPKGKRTKRKRQP